MPNRTNSFSPAFQTFVPLLLQLHHLIAAGEGDSDAADAVRDQMDVPWRNLTEDEVLLARGLSSDLYSIGASPNALSAASEGSAEVFAKARDDGDWRRALAVLRTHEAALAPADIASLRGVCWDSLGMLDVAVEFFREAVRLEPENPRWNATLLLSLFRAGETAAALALADDLALRIRDATCLFWVAYVYFSEARNPGANDLYQKVLDISDRALELVKTEPRDDNWPLRVFTARLNRSISFAALERLSDALYECDQALLLQPDDPDALNLHAWLSKDTDPDRSRQEIVRGLHRRSIDTTDTTTSNVALSINIPITTAILTRAIPS